MISDPFRLAVLTGSLLSTMALSASAQSEMVSVDKKLYCWNQNGQRICSDILPQDAVDRARDEFDARSGLRSAEIGKALDAEERVVAAAAEAQRRADDAAEQTRKRTDQAMLTSYQNEDELRRVFGERIQIIDNNVHAARYNVTNLREGLVVLLHNAGERELAGQKVADTLADDIRQRHTELLRQQRLLASFEQQRRDLDVEIEQTLQRYRKLKSVPTTP